MTGESLRYVYKPRTLESKQENMPTVEKIRVIVESALCHFGEREPDNRLINPLKKISNSERHERFVVRETAQFRGQLSTNPNLVNKYLDRKEIDKISLGGNCEIFSHELQRCLNLVGQKSKKIDSNYHTYLIKELPEEKIVIDPTIGQYINYTAVFVGPPEKLKKLVFENAQKGTLAKIDYEGVGSLSEPEAFFKEIWGGKN